MKIKKVGELHFNEYKTEFFVSDKTATYLEKENLSLATLLPDGWMWYEVILFDVIDEDNDGEPDKKYGKSFKVIYNGIILKRNLTKEGSVEETTMQEDTKLDGEEITNGTSLLNGPKGKDYYVKYTILKND